MNREQLNNFFEKISPDQEQKTKMYIEIKKNALSVNKLFKFKYVKICASILCSLSIVFLLIPNKENYETANLLPVKDQTYTKDNTKYDDNDVKFNTIEKYNSDVGTLETNNFYADISVMQADGENERKETVNTDDNFNVSEILNIPEDLVNQRKIVMKTTGTEKQNPKMMFEFENESGSRKLFVNVHKENLYEINNDKNVYIYNGMVFVVECLNISEEELKNLINY